ncbi:MAG: UDP-2,3-diacylglucosamine diphosphatase LpxI [Holosporales bacterium]|nr:UDP-2,3-diacylglucosamine diphosphatase LpxI [Holosporales bacterium]
MPLRSLQESSSASGGTAVHRNTDVVAVIAGSGDLPLRIISKLDSLQRKYVVVSLDGFGPSGYQQFKIGSIGQILSFIKEASAKSVLFCGGVKRPSLRLLHLDSVGKKWLRQLGVRAFLGDNSILSGMMRLIEKEGFTVVSPQSILDTLLSPRGVMTVVQPSDADLQDIARGIFVLNAMSKADVGQAAIVQDGVVLGLEAVEGTKGLLERCKDLKLSGSRGGVLVKLSKVDQEQSVDLPTIGKNTIIEAHEASLAGIAVGAEQSQILDFEDTVKLANSKKLFLIGV